MFHPDLMRHPDGCPALVLNADYTPLSYYPLSVWPWQTAVKAVFLDRVDIVAHYERAVHSPTRTLQLPSVIALKQFVRPSQFPAFPRFNLFLRDTFACQYCGVAHVEPPGRAGREPRDHPAITVRMIGRVLTGRIGCCHHAVMLARESNGQAREDVCFTPISCGIRMDAPHLY